jgi:hypothetical protein
MNYEKVLNMSKEIERKHGRELKKTYAMITKKVSIQDFKKFTKTQKEKDSFDQIDDEDIKNITKIIIPILSIIGFSRGIHLTVNYFSKRTVTKPDLETIFQLFLATIWVSILMTYFEKEKYLHEVDDKNTETYDIFRQTMENRKRWWRKLKSLSLVDLTLDLIVSGLKMSVRMFKWQIGLAKENSFYLMLFMLNILLNTLLVINIIRYYINANNG